MSRSLKEKLENFLKKEIKLDRLERFINLQYYKEKPHWRHPETIKVPCPECSLNLVSDDISVMAELIHDHMEQHRRGYLRVTSRQP